MFDNFPYTNFHEMNLDWMIKIAKDFLDQYTHIQETITQGLEDLDTKAQQLEALLQAWYDQHSHDIADQLADALADLNEWYTQHENYLDNILLEKTAAFERAANEKGAEVIASIPADYSTFYIETTKNLSEISNMKFTHLAFTTQSSKYLGRDGVIDDISSADYLISGYVDISGNNKIAVSAMGDWNNCYCAFYDTNYLVLSTPLMAAAGGTITTSHYRILDVPENAVYVCIGGIKRTGVPFLMDVSTITYVTTGLAEKIGNNQLEGLQKTYDPYTLTIETGKFINRDSGYVEDISSGAYIVATNIDVEDVPYVRISGCATYGNGVCAFYDVNGILLDVPVRADPDGTPDIYRNYELTVPPAAKYMAVASMTGDPSFLGNPEAGYFSGYAMDSPNWKRLKWVCLGDSLTEANFRTTKHYHDYIAEETGIEVVNMGKSGSGYKRIGGSGDNFYMRALTIPTDADVVTIFGSGNDAPFFDNEMGTATDTGTDTLGGCINTTIDNIYSRIPAVQLGIVAPTPWTNTNPGDPNDGMCRYTELLRQICWNRSIPFLDLLHESNLRPWDPAFRAIAYSNDDGYGVHPDETGHKLITGRFRTFVDSLLGIINEE